MVNWDAVIFDSMVQDGITTISAAIGGATSRTRDNRVYLRNAYRVLLTRARQGMVVFVPPGDSADPTRSPSFYNSTFKYLKELGISEIR